MADLTGIRALITGGSSGLGRAMAVALVEAGAAVAVTSRELVRAQAVADELGERAVGVELDVRDEASVQAGVDRAYAELGGLDLLVNNAGIGMRTVNPRFLDEPRPFWEVPPGGFRDVIETKMVGSFLVARAVVPRMLADDGGRVVMISMNEETMVRRGFVPYGPAGSGLEALATVMVADLEGSPVTVNILLPGAATATGMIPDGVSPEVRARLLDPAVMGPAIVWLASPEARAVHGERIVAAGFQEWLSRREREG